MYHRIHLFNDLHGLHLSGQRTTVCGLAGVSDDERRALTAAGVRFIDSMTFSADRDRFINGYIAVVAGAGEQQKDLWWWATDLSSKIVFKTGFMHLMEKCFIVLRAINAHEGDDLYIIGAPWPLWPLIAGVAGTRLATSWRSRYFFERVRSVAAANVKSPARAVYHIVRMAYRVIRARQVLGRKIEKELPQGPCNLVRSNTYAHSYEPKGSYKDVCFGALIPYISERAKLVVLVQAFGDYEAVLRGMAVCRETVVPWEYFLKLRDIFRYGLVPVFWRPRLVAGLIFEQVNVSSIVNDEIARTAGRIGPYQLLQYPASLRVAGRLALERVITIYEGNPWCKMFILAIRQRRQEARIIGYQHTVVPQSFGSMYLAPGEFGRAPLPDVLLTVGEKTRDIIERYSAFPRGRVQACCALRMAPMPQSPAPRKPVRRILVAAEGVAEAGALIKLAFDQLAGSTEYEVVFRFHPTLPAEFFRERLQFRFEDHANFRVSKRLLSEDLHECDLVMYWSTTVSLEMLALGKPVIHFHNATFLSMDPLFDCPHLKWTVTSDQHLEDTFNEIRSLSDSEYRLRQDRAREYLSRYFLPVREESLQAFFPKKT